MNTNRAIVPPEGDLIITRSRGQMIVEAAPPVQDAPDVGPASDLQKAEVERLREERRKEAEARSMALRAKAEKNRRRTA